MRRIIKVALVLVLVVIVFEMLFSYESLTDSRDCFSRLDLPAEYNSDYQQRWDNARQHCNTAVRFAHKNQVPWQVVMAIIVEESSGYTSAQSEVGAVGLMGVMPNDAQYSDTFTDRPPTEVLLDPVENIRWGSSILAQFIEQAKVYPTPGMTTLWTALRMYNGSRPVADAYAHRVCYLAETLGLAQDKC